MITLEKINAIKRLKEEYEDICSHPMFEMGIVVNLTNPDNIWEWTCLIKGPKGTSYEKGLFVVKIKFTEYYPHVPPEICFKTPIYYKKQLFLINQDLYLVNYFLNLLYY